MSQEIFDGQGFLTEKGKSFLNDFNKELKYIFNSSIVDNMTNSQVRGLGAILSKLVGDQILNSIVERNKNFVENQ